MATTQTIYSQLTNLLHGRDERLAADGTSEQPQVLKANSAEERSELVLQTQQQRHFSSQLLQLMQADTQRRVYFEGTRRQQYMEYEAMEEYPDIARALDLLAEEATMGSIKGRALNIYSDNDRVKTVLSDLFYKQLDIPTLLFFWARNMIKHGDCFLYLSLAAGAGITGARLLSTLDTERHEAVTGESSQASFRHHLSTGTIQEYTVWQVAHFRMLGNERRMPYGTSVLFRIRRTYKMLMMAKDAVLVYRLTRAPERRVHKIYTGNINPADVPDYLQAVANGHKKAPLVNPRTGDINFEYQPATMDMDYFVGVSNESSGTQIDTLPGACLALDTRIPLLDGRTLRLEQIIAAHEAGEKLWVYSINPATGRVVPGPITWAGVTRRDTEVLKITLDNGEEIITTPDHKFPTRTGAITEAKNLEVGESLFSFTRIRKQLNASQDAVEMVYDHEKQEYVCTHDLAARAVPTEELVFNQTLADLDQETSRQESIRIVSIEYLARTQDTGTITVDGPEQYHKFHNFALASGVFTQNSNLDALGDLRLLEDDLFGGLGIPKSFIKFNSDSGGSAGDGKSFAMLDLRLARLVSRIQQALLGELNRLALIHLYLLGDDFHEELTNFTLTMNSPSVQLELMHEELRGAQLDNYVKATTPSGEGVAPMSAAQAMKDILGMSEAEVKQNFKDQFYESKIYAEIKAAPDLLPTSGLYDDILRFAQAGQPKKDAPAGGEPGGEPGGAPGGDFPGGDFPGGPPPPGGDPFPGGEPGGNAGGPPPTGPGPGTLTEQTRRAGARLLEMAQLLAADPTL